MNLPLDSSDLAELPPEIRAIGMMMQAQVAATNLTLNNLIKQFKSPQVSTPSAMSDTHLPQVSTPSVMSDTHPSQVSTPSAMSDTHLPQVSTPSAMSDTHLPRLDREDTKPDLRPGSILNPIELDADTDDEDTFKHTLHQSLNLNQEGQLDENTNDNGPRRRRTTTNRDASSQKCVSCRENTVYIGQRCRSCTNKERHNKFCEDQTRHEPEFVERCQRSDPRRSTRDPYEQVNDISASNASSTSSSYGRSAREPPTRRQTSTFDNRSSTSISPIKEESTSSIKTSKTSKTSNAFKCDICGCGGKYYCRGLCQPCYNRFYRKGYRPMSKTGKCIECNENERIVGKQHCRYCYRLKYGTDREAPFQTSKASSPNVQTEEQARSTGTRCIKCHVVLRGWNMLSSIATNYCRTCYTGTNQRICVICKELKRHHAKGKCAPCYQQIQQQLRRRRRFLKLASKPIRQRAPPNACWF